MVRRSALVVESCSLPHGSGINGPSSSSESEQDSTVTSSSPPEMRIGVVDGGGSLRSSSSLSDDANEREYSAVIDLLEQKMNAEESNGGNEGLAPAEPQVGAAAAGQASPHSVEYWTVSKHGKPKTFLRRYPANRRNWRQQGGSRRLNHQLTVSPQQTGMQEGNLFGGAPPPPPPQLFNTNFVPAPLAPAHQFQPFPNPFFMQVPSPLHVYSAPPPAPAPPMPSIQIFIPPEHAWTAPPAASPYMPFPSMNQFAAPPSLFPLSQQQSYGGATYYGTPPLSPNSFPLTAPPGLPPVSFFQGAPIFYQVPSAPMATGMNPMAQPFLGDCNLGYERQFEYPPPPYEDAILTTSSAAPTNEFIPGQFSEMEVDSSSNEVTQSQAVNDNPWQVPSCFLTPSATPSSSDMNLCNMSQVDGTDEATNSAATSGYSSCTSSPLVTTSQINPETNESGDENVKESIADSSISSVDEETLFASDGNPESVERQPEEKGVARPGLERFSMELRELNNACINTMIQDAIHHTANIAHHYQQNLMVYPGDSSILIYSQNDGNRSVILYNEQEIPYVANVFDFRVQASFKEQCGPALSYPYYVPPHTADNDFFGGQLPIWQLKMGQHFLKYQPHNWKMHGVPETFNVEMFLGRVMDTLGEFHIVSKLRFSCRTCKTPWTSKKGTIVFKFCYNSAFQQGWILMRIFGQICMQPECCDQTFQNPACYPEEIDRAMKKLSEYIGNQCYGIAVNPSCFDECFKSIRRSGNVGKNNSGSKERERSNLPPTPHKRELCQACMNGVCKNLFAKPFLTASKRIQSS